MLRIFYHVAFIFLTLNSCERYYNKPDWLGFRNDDKLLAHADSLSESDSLDLALRCYLLLKHNSERNGDLSMAGRANMGLANIMRRSANYNEEINYANNAVEQLAEAGEDILANAARWHIQAGLASLKENDSSLFVGNIVTCAALEYKDTSTLAKSLETTIHVYRRQLPYSADTLMMTFRNLEQLKVPISPSVIAEIAAAERRLGNVSGAKEYLETAKKIHCPKEQRLIVEYEEYMMALNTDAQFAHEVLVNMWNTQQQLYRQRQKTSIMAVKDAFNELMLEEDAAMRTQMKERYVAIIIIISLALLFAVILFYRQRRINLLERAHVVEELDARIAAYEELKHAVDMKDADAVRIGFDTLDALCVEYYTGGNAKERRVAESFEHMVLKYREDPVFWNSFEERVDRMHGGVLGLMKTELSGFKADDFRLMTYVVSGMSYFSISVLMGVDKPNLYNRAKRLRERIRNSGAPHTDLFLSALSRG